MSNMLDLAVLETRLQKKSNVSVKGAFDAFADVLKGNPSAYHYEMFNNAESLAESVPRVARTRRNIYISAHGNRRSLFGAEGSSANQIRRYKFKNILMGSDQTAGFKGLFISSCKTCNKENAEFLAEEVKFYWIAGYSENIDIIFGLAIELYFWRLYYGVKSEESERTRICTVAKKMERFADMGLRIFARENRVHRTGPMKQLLPRS